MVRRGLPKFFDLDALGEAFWDSVRGPLARGASISVAWRFCFWACG